MEPVLTTLVLSAAGIVVKTVTTDGYELVRNAILKLWRRHQPDEAEKIGRTLDTTRAELAKAAEIDAAEAARGFDAEWQTYFKVLLRDHPEAADDVREVVEELTPLVVNNSQSAGSIKQIAKVQGGISIQAGNSVSNVNIGKNEQL
jgi:hypothetical protein